MNASDTYKNLQFTVHDIYVHFKQINLPIYILKNVA